MQNSVITLINQTSIYSDIDTDIFSFAAARPFLLAEMDEQKMMFFRELTSQTNTWYSLIEQETPSL